MAEFRIPNRIIYGNGSIESLASIKGIRMLLVHDNPAMAEICKQHLFPSGMELRLFHADPACANTAHILEGTKAMMEFKPDWVLSVGGHSAMDTAKLLRIFYRYPQLSVDDLRNADMAAISLPNTKHMAVPGYNTNGSEVTCRAYAAISENGAETEVSSPALIPDTVIIDPELLCCANDVQQAQCVLSTLLLAAEAAADTENCFTTPLAFSAMEMTVKSVMAHTAAPSCGSTLLHAQCLAGMASGNSAPQLCSRLCHGAMHTFYSTSLGGLAAVFLPAVIRTLPVHTFSAAAEAMGLKSPSALADAIEEYADMLGLPLSLREMGSDRNVFLKALSKTAHRIASNLPKDMLPEKDAQKIIEDILRIGYSQGEFHP